MRRDLEHLLGSAAGAAPDGPDPAFVSALGARLDAMAAGPPVSSGPPPGSDTTVGARPLSPVVPLAAAAAVIVVMAAAVATVGRGPGGGPPAGLRLASAAGTTVLEPDGRRLAGVAGLRLGDGAVVQVGPGGQAVAGDVVLGPGATAIVRDGHLQPLPTGQALGPSPTTTTPPSPSPARQKGPVLGDGTTTTTVQPGPVMTTRPTPPTTAPAATTHLILEARNAAGGVGLTWSTYEGPGFSRYLVLWADAPGDPAYPPDYPRTQVAPCDGSNRASTSCFDPQDPSAKSTAPRRYMVVAVDADGRELARSDAVAPS